MGGRHAVLGAARVLAPALPGTVVGADAGGGLDLGDDAGPRGGDLAQTVLEHDGGAALAAAVQVEPVAPDLIAGAGRGVAVLVADDGHVFVDGGHGREGQDGNDRDEHPASAAREVAPRL